MCQAVHALVASADQVTVTDVAESVPARLDCCLNHAGHTPHWIPVLKQAPKHGYVFGTLTPDPALGGVGAFRFVPNTTFAHTVPDEDCVETMLFKHDPDRLIRTMAALGEVGRWIVGVHLLQLVRHSGAHRST